MYRVDELSEKHMEWLRTRVGIDSYALFDANTAIDIAFRNWFLERAETHRVKQCAIDTKKYRVVSIFTSSYGA